MNNEEAIEYLKNLIKNPTISQDPFYTTKIAIDTVLNYIEKLEKRLKEKENIVKKSSLEAQKYFDMLMEVEYGRDTIPKQKIRDKIEELKKQTSTINDKQISKKYSHTQFARECCIGLLKELLEEGK